jgi:hypothetical protein
MDKITGDYQLVREKTNTYVNQSDMLFFVDAYTYNLFDILCNHLMFYYVYMPLHGPSNLDQ